MGIFQLLLVVTLVSFEVHHMLELQIVIKVIEGYKERLEQWTTKCVFQCSSALYITCSMKSLNLLL